MTVLMKKRSRDEDMEVENFVMANCLMLLSRLEQNKNKNNSEAPTYFGRVYRCKTCDKEFQSFQALGGHRASHKKPKLFASDLLHHSPEKPKTHECSICGLDFAIGQALGGHMRRHRGAMPKKSDEETSINSADRAPVMMSLIRKSNSKRVLCLNLDLTLAQPENDLKLKLGNFLQLGFNLAD